MWPWLCQPPKSNGFSSTSLQSRRFLALQWAGASHRFPSIPINSHLFNGNPWNPSISHLPWQENGHPAIHPAMVVQWCSDPPSVLYHALAIAVKCCRNRTCEPSCRTRCGVWRIVNKCDVFAQVKGVDKPWNHPVVFRVLLHHHYINTLSVGIWALKIIHMVEAMKNDVKEPCQPSNRIRHMYGVSPWLSVFQPDRSHDEDEDDDEDEE